MYSIPYFKAQNIQEVIAFMQAHPFVTLCGCDKENHPVATHIPVLINIKEEKIYLRAHVMRKQKHTLAFQHNSNVLAIFSGAHSYVSASWYSKKNVGSTWNYLAVHAKGNIKFLDDKALLQVLTDLTKKFENNDESPALVDKMDEDYLNKLMPSIVAIEIEITSLDNVFKLSQNRDEKSYENIIQQLSKQGEDANMIADEMKKRKDQLFNK